ncbi:MAG: Gfo/Idh/MocA family oxidoreductase [Candidatus Latescibacteria bacterium]|jgi:predicted dehydrogenase|nr:Gfo/Idh/MocA family oxidoreductase [Candidatus Latescibacterota bacterium]
MDPVKFGIVGIGGFGRVHVKSIEALEQDGRARLDAAVVIDPENHPEKLAEFATRNVRIYDNIEDLISAGGVDYITLPIGIHHHVPLSVQSLEAGFNVVCEKPIAATIQDANRLVDAKNKTGKTVLIGYQSIYAHSTQTIKTRLLEGRLGKLNAIRIKGGWPRGHAYYTRNGWAGRLSLDDGTPVLDSPINNAMAHDVNNAMYLCGTSQHTSAEPETVQAELYRARDIETFDTASMRIMANGVEVIIGLSHSTHENFNPIMVLDCEKGQVEWTRGNAIIRYSDGTEENFDERNLPDHNGPFHNAIDVLRNNAAPQCPPEVARAQTLCINGAHESCPEISTISTGHIKEVDRKGDLFHIVNEMDDLLDRSFAEKKLLSELGVAWGRTSKPFDMKNYDHYPKR